MSKVRVLVDGFNVLHSVVLKGRDRQKWWRAENQLKVLELARQFRWLPTDETAPVFEIGVVFDAARPESERCEAMAPVSVHFAPNADDWLVKQARERGSARVIIVSADRSLQDRAARRGAEKMSPWQFAEQAGLVS